MATTTQIFLKKNPSANSIMTFWWGNKFKNCLTRHLLRKKPHMSPYLDDEFLVIRQN